VIETADREVPPDVRIGERVGESIQAQAHYQGDHRQRGRGEMLPASRRAGGHRGGSGVIRDGEGRGKTPRGSSVKTSRVDHDTGRTPRR
jgi:hypothetical protein